MSAPPRVSNEHLRAAIEATGGNLSAAAGVVGIARQNFRKRLEDSGVGPAELARLRDEAQRAVRTLRLPGDVFERIRSAKFDLQAKLRIELDEAAVLGLFMGDAFETWLQQKLGR
jgi:hypothetical protein